MNNNQYPFISILIAARNEQDNIIDCLTALEHLTWPKEKFEVLIGNDHSEDNTKILVEDYIKDKSNFQLYSPPLTPSPPLIPPKGGKKKGGRTGQYFTLPQGKSDGKVPPFGGDLGGLSNFILCLTKHHFTLKAGDR